MSLPEGCVIDLNQEEDVLFHFRRHFYVSGEFYLDLHVDLLLSELNAYKTPYSFLELRMFRRSSVLELQSTLDWNSYLNIFIPQVVAVALRCPSGRVLKRRFFKSCSSQVRKFIF